MAEGQVKPSLKTRVISSAVACRTLKISSIGDLQRASRLLESVWVESYKPHASDQSPDSSLREWGCSAHTVKNYDAWMLIEMDMLGLMLLLLGLILVLIVIEILILSASGSHCMGSCAKHGDFFKGKPLSWDNLLWPHNFWGLRLWARWSAGGWWTWSCWGEGGSNSNRVRDNNLRTNDLSFTLGWAHIFSVLDWSCVVEEISWAICSIKVVSSLAIDLVEIVVVTVSFDDLYGNMIRSDNSYQGDWISGLLLIRFHFSVEHNFPFAKKNEVWELLSSIGPSKGHFCEAFCIYNYWSELNNVF